MKKLLVLSIMAVFIFAGCNKETPITITKTSKVEDAKVTLAKERLINFMRENKSTFDMLHQDAKRSNNKGLSSNADINFNKMLIDRAINPDDYECGPTEVDYYIGDVTEDWTDDDWDAFFGYSDFIWYYYWLVNNDASNQSFGINGVYTNVTNRTFKSLGKFWDPSNKILLFGAHGSFFDDEDKVVAVLTTLFGVPEAAAEGIADDVATVFGSDNFWNFSHPLLSFNAFASDPYAPFTDYYKIIMGDGIQDMYKELGYGDVATQAILAHEFGHQMQFDIGVEFEGTPESTRKTELMADALSAYFLTHKRGATMNWKRVQQFLPVFYSIGDCQFSSPGHHGTPNQRLKAATFGYEVANDTKKKGQIMSAEDFVELFEDALSDILASDK